MDTNKKHDALSIREFLKTIGFSEHELTASLEYINRYHSITEIESGLIEGIKLSSVVTYRLAKIGRIQTQKVKSGKQEYHIYHLYDVVQYILERDLFFEQVNNKKLLTFDYILRQYGHTGKEYLGSKYIDAFKRLHENGLLKLILLGEKLYPYPENFFFVLGDSYESFNNEFISIEEASKVIGIKPDRFFRKFHGEVVSLLAQNKFRFINRNDLENISEFLSKPFHSRSRAAGLRQEGYVSKRRAAKELGIGINTLDIVLEDNLIPAPISNTAYITLQNLEDLKSRQAIMFEEFSKRYLTRGEIFKNYGIRNPSKNLEKVYPPRLICINKDGKDWTGLKALYSIEEVEELVKRKTQDKRITLDEQHTQLMYSTVESAPYETFLVLKKELKLDFSENAKDTESWWLKYIERKLKKTVANFDTKAAVVSRLLKITELLIVNTLDMAKGPEGR
ncbi:hypothetical protein ABEX47_03065, partial [Paenibacillus ehimensis]|uniref:hypothetical protein n=1 Tax=Paenibacillus ehimensis TaxID=79264 RepID=UPI003D26527B